MPTTTNYAVMITPEIQGTIASPPAAAQTPAGGGDGFSFRELLSDLNPLQYLPVVGTIYRAITGDTIPDALRTAGALVVSAVMGGPIGVILTIGSTIFEKATGFDPEKILAAQFHPAAPVTTPPVATPPVAAAPADTVAAAPADTIAAAPADTVAAAPADTVAAQPALTPAFQLPLSAEQLAAYGIRSSPSGVLRCGDVEGADVLNGIELVRLGKLAAETYRANQPAASTPGPARAPRAVPAM